MIMIYADNLNDNDDDDDDEDQRASRFSGAPSRGTGRRRTGAGNEHLFKKLVIKISMMISYLNVIGNGDWDLK